MVFARYEREFVVDGNYFLSNQFEITLTETPTIIGATIKEMISIFNTPFRGQLPILIIAILIT